MLALLSSLSPLSIFATIIFIVFIGTVLWLNWPSKEYRAFIKEQKKHKDR